MMAGFPKLRRHWHYEAIITCRTSLLFLHAEERYLAPSILELGEQRGGKSGRGYENWGGGAFCKSKPWIFHQFFGPPPIAKLRDMSHLGASSAAI